MESAYSSKVVATECTGGRHMLHKKKCSGTAEKEPVFFLNHAFIPKPSLEQMSVEVVCWCVRCELTMSYNVLRKKKKTKKENISKQLY